MNGGADEDTTIIRRGERAGYYWLTAAGEVYLGTVLRLCPEAVLNRFLAVTSLDSGVKRLADDEVASGWYSHGEVAYSPLITSLDWLRVQRDGADAPGYDEWYVFTEPRTLKSIFHGNFFEFQPETDQMIVFVNMFAFVLHDREPYMPGILDVFWNQLASSAPETFIADGRDCLTFVSRDRALVDCLASRLVE